ncbi:hypothetical protein FNAPI_1287 [Fusarium napiforme]|uniref:Heterokaryon incompatibility domain-containing protein n=1 Tax=Fusarium napiforme TaxID=42672 RepID=A0A8H5NJ58_9HYPO|nr:hypothetical protein FNAPI_1287 [Fusarium napiforme]
MRVTISIGFRYLWIDQVCIDQKSTEDMTCQLGQMNTIYNQASVTIVAAAGKSASYGLPGVGDRPRMVPNKFTLNGSTWMFRCRLSKHIVDETKWSTRGWTYQEAVFSRRCVIFTDDQVLFQCGCMTCAEESVDDLATCEQEGFPIFERMADKESDSRQDLPRGRRFMRDLEAYSKRELTYDSDVLRAMEGVFSFYAQLEPSVEQYWGLPLRWVGCKISIQGSEDYDSAKSKHDDVAGALLWAMLWEPAWNKVQDIRNGLTKRSGVPTWSWAAWKVEVRWSYLTNIDHLEKNFTVPLFVETMTGDLVEPNDEFARSLASGKSCTALGLSHVLRITTTVFDLPFIERAPYRPTILYNSSASYPTIQKGQHWVTKDQRYHEANWTHFLVQKNIGVGRGLVWFLDLTHGGVTSSSDLAFDTDTETINPRLLTLRCIVISHDRGMIVQSSSGISKRVGLLRFEGEFF